MEENTINRNFEIEMECKTDKMTEDKAKAIIPKLEKLIKDGILNTGCFSDKYNDIDVDFLGNDKDYGKLYLFINCDEPCCIDEEEGILSYFDKYVINKWGEDYISMFEEIVDKAFNDINVKCYHKDIFDSSQTVDDLYEILETRDFREEQAFDYYRDMG